MPCLVTLYRERSGADLPISTARCPRCSSAPRRLRPRMTTRADDLALAPAHSAIATFVADTRRLERVPVHGWSLLGAALGRLAPPHLLAAAHALLKTRVDEELVPTYIKAEAARQGLKTVRGKAYAVTATRASPARASAATVHIADSPPLARTGNGRERHAHACGRRRRVPDCAVRCTGRAVPPHPRRRGRCRRLKGGPRKVGGGRSRGAAGSARCVVRARRGCV